MWLSLETSPEKRFRLDVGSRRPEVDIAIPLRTSCKKTFRPKSKIVGPRSKQRFRLGLPQKHNVDRGRNAADNIVRGPSRLTGSTGFGSNFPSGEVGFQTGYGCFTTRAAHLTTALGGRTCKCSARLAPRVIHVMHLPGSIGATKVLTRFVLPPKHCRTKTPMVGAARLSITATLRGRGGGHNDEKSW